MGRQPRLRRRAQSARHREAALTGVGSISVLLPTFQGAAFLERVLAALAAQTIDTPWDLSVVDSGSSDGTLAILERARATFPVPMSVRTIHPLEFDHGDTRNALAAESAGELLVFLTQDAIPGAPDWLARLAANFADPDVGAAYCRNVPRPDADLLTRTFSADDPGYAPGRRVVRLPEDYARMDPHARRLLYNFNDVASAIRRELWRRHPFPRTEFGEDLLMARALLEAGHAIVYDVDAVVEHSHDYAPAEMRARCRIDGRFNVEWLGRTCVSRPRDADALVARTLERDRGALAAAGRTGAELERELARARALREAAFHGLYEGGLSPRRRPATRARPGAQLAVLYVVHGFPPQTWAGTEVYTLELARAMQRLGHRVAVLARADAPPVEEGGPEEFALVRGEFQGLPVWRMTHRIGHQNLRESYAHPRAEEIFRRVLDEERPDVVHFQHLLHFSANLVRIARERRVATVATLNDYWGLCARVQLIRPDGVRCDENQELGCLVCVKQKDYARIPSARRWFPRVAPLVAAAEAVLRLPKAPSVKLERILHKRRVRLGRWVAGWRDMQARQSLVIGNLSEADLALAPSRFLREKYLATARFDPHRLVYSDYGMPTAHLRAPARRADPQGRVRFGFVGSLVWYKGVDVLLEALRRLPAGRAHLAVFGHFDPAGDAYHARLAELADAERVSFRGRFDNERLSDVYADFDVLVVPSIWFENSPLTIHEAFLLRTPVVTSDIGGMAELVTDGVDGLHFRVGDAADLAAKLARFVAEPDLVARLSQRFPRVKTIDENAREMDWRYRALSCVVRD